MSDNIQDLVKQFENDVLRNVQPRNMGLFPIPEYPELEADQGMWSAALHGILTTLRYLAPATLLTLFWGQQSFLFRLLKGIDNAIRAIVFSSEEQKQEVLQWLEEAGTVRVEHLETVWRHGWILCGVLDAAMPGACPGHPPTRQSIKHAQTIAEHYLGVEPVFSRQELESNDSLSRHQEWKLATYIDRIRKALSKLTPPVSKPTSQRTSPETPQIILDYVARGSGLVAAQLNSKTHFKIYPTTQQSLDPGDITILIKGPKDTYGMTIANPILGKAQQIRQKLLGLQHKPTYTETALPLTQGVTYMRNYGKMDMNKTYHIPKTAYDIEIEVENEEDHINVSYTVALEGTYEISITSRGQHIVGSPFTMSASKNIIETLQKDSFTLEDGEEIDIVDVKTDKKVVLRVVDFITEKMLLRENGTLEKISEDEANILMSMECPKDISDVESENYSVASTRSDDFKLKPAKFNKAAYKVVQMNRVCKIICSLLAEKRRREKAFVRPRSQQSIPDIVNSTFSEVNPFTSEKRDKVIVPENISVSLRTEKGSPYYKKEKYTAIEGHIKINTSVEIDSPDSLEKFESIPEQNDNYFQTERPLSASNPFMNACEQTYELEKDLGSFVKTEYERNKSDVEETDAPIKIMVESFDNSNSPSPISTNPFVEPDVIILERPKTPVLKIITGEIKDREDSVFVDPKKKELLLDEILGNEFVNPFFLHQEQHKDRLPVTDFIIGAPVSLPPIIRATTPEPVMDSIFFTGDNKITSIEKNKSVESIPTSAFSTRLRTSLQKTKEFKKNDDNPVSSLFYSFDSTESDNVEIVSLSNSDGPYQQRNITPKKDLWDSAYVSIDDNNSSPDSNNNENSPVSENPIKPKFSLSDIDNQYIKMGPAEREIWESCLELNEKKIQDEPKPKWDNKRAIFTPIIEESERSMSTGMKDTSRSESDLNTVTVAFAELNDMYRNFFSKNEFGLSTSSEIHKNNTTQKNDMSVDSASAITDVKRHEENLEGTISEVQANVTESVSASHTLRTNEQIKDTNDETPFGDDNKSNIVLEKKQYWDQRIREIQAKSTEEDKTQQKRKRLSARHLRQNDSLTKRRGKQIVKNVLNASESWKTQNKSEIKDIEIVSRKSPLSHNNSPDLIQTDVKLVEKWKNYWDNKLQSEDVETNMNCFRSKSPNSKESSTSPQPRYSSDDDIIEAYNKPVRKQIESTTIPKQELPEEVFKAFETSPKRFFGTSRKQIWNKIDTFLGKPSTADESSPEVSGAACAYDTGLVSSRISLFHTISQTEELLWARRKSQSMHSIYKRKDSEKSIDLCKEAVTNITSEKQENKKDSEEKAKETLVSKEKDFTQGRHKPKLERKYVTIDSEEIKKQAEKTVTTLKDKRARFVQNASNKSFDDSLLNASEANTVDVQTNFNNVKKTIKAYSQTEKPKFKTINILRKSSVSKSEMDIFSKITNKTIEDDLDKYKSCDELPKINVKSFISLYESVSKDIAKPERKLGLTRGSQRLSLSSSSTGAVNHIGPTFKTTKLYKPTSETDDSTTDLHQSRNNNWNTHDESISSESCEPRSLDSVDIDIIPLKDQAKKTTYVSLSDIELEIVENHEQDKQNDDAEIATVDYKSRFKKAKQFFQSLDDVSEIKKPKKLNECEKLLLNESSESLETEEQKRPPRRVKKNIKSHSMPSSELSQIWNQLKETQNQNDTNKLVKISEKFNVDDLFNDVMEGRLSRQGSLRGIPHKKAVLETFRSMENLTDKKINSYEITASQLNDFAKENQIRNAQTYLTEYPYLPTTDPAKYHSRLDAKASGLITLKELLTQKPRRNSVPDLRVNPSFNVQL